MEPGPEPTARHRPGAAARARLDPPGRVLRDGVWWLVGTAAEVEWIHAGTTPGLSITAAIPPVFSAYATVVVPDGAEERAAHARALLAVLSDQSAGEPWWLGYLETGAADVVFPQVPRISLYARWPYVLVQAGPAQAATWRSGEWPSPRCALPDLMFPRDRTWLVSTLWDDDWTCLGGPSALVERVLHHPALRTRARQVDVGGDATPPGHRTI